MISSWGDFILECLALFVLLYVGSMLFASGDDKTDVGVTQSESETTP